MLYLTVSLCSLVVAQKVCNIGSVDVMAGSLVYPLTFPISDILTEIYGYKRAKTAIGFSFVFQILFALICLAIVNVKSPLSYAYASDYALVLGHLLHIALGSLFAAIVGAFLNIYLISKSKIMLRGRLFGLRSLVSSLTGELLYTVIAILLMNIGSPSFSHTPYLIASSMLVKLVYNLITIVPAICVVIVLKRLQEVNNEHENDISSSIAKLNIAYEAK